MRTLRTVVAIALTTVLATACDDSPAAPTRDPPPLPPDVNRLELSGQNTIAPGMTADIVAMRGDYLADATALRQMAFVMKGGRVFKYQP